MLANFSAPWHKASYDKFLNEGLPQLLAEKMPLGSYRVESGDGGGCRVSFSVTTASGDTRLDFPNLPQPNDEGVFLIDGERRVVLPMASSDDLANAEIRCVGEQALDFIKSRLGQMPDHFPNDESLARALAPLDVWLGQFLRTGEPFGDLADIFQRGSSSQALDATNWLATQAHLRRILVTNMRHVVRPSQFGLACPFETPEGPNIGRVLSIAVGAEICGGKIVVVDKERARCSEAGLGLTASMVPFLEHDDANRLLMGANMMRQWQIPLEPEPALVQTGNELNAPGFWCGANFLTAFVSWGGDTYEDSIVISESCAKRFRFDHAVEAGDKISNRHGAKATIGRILPDDEMPHLADGTAVELVYDFIGLHPRMNFGQIREALMGRIARVEGAAILAAPFHAPLEDQIRNRLVKNGLPESGMETLRKGKSGPLLERPSTVGWVYWGRTFHDVRDKIHTSVSRKVGQPQGELEYYALRDAGAFENLAECFNLKSLRRVDADTLVSRVAAGPVRQAPAPTPWFLDLARRLRVGGVKAEMADGTISFQMAAPAEPALKLATPVAHPWLREREIESIGALENDRRYEAVADANRKVERLMADGAPGLLTRKAVERLKQAVQELFDSLITRSDMRLYENNLFSGRSVIVVGPELRIDQVGLPEEMAWDLFGPLVAREMGDEKEATKRSKRAETVLDSLMAKSWTLINRAPSFWTASILAFHPVRVPGNAIRLHPLACPSLNADFDGDQVAVFLPLTEAAQREADERLSIAGHLRRDTQRMLPWLCPDQDVIWGLAEISRTEEGLKTLREMMGTDPDRRGGLSHKGFAEGGAAWRHRTRWSGEGVGPA